ncbi:hypothetical protein U2G15_001170 [Escherichia coli]|uniref:Uncharacterized protein n=1 Tax=Escherichia coli TaxID=562 RepID=A0A6D0FYL5_ECOLX|nr:hypothetical protein [Escherichia coli]EMA2216869.1 hypothetical protein [Escherichia coli]KAE9731637.1 hypothetical protein GP711_13300 [Escherichia coli]KAE9732589.1 hypothetical protein GP709_16185 [Escherichia coli]MVV59947.1 hypothetical protein [Escherichia coli]MVV69013.1 hypothetical protein [Escherichia coli]
MATIPNQTHPLISVPFNAATDFTLLAEHCKQFAEILIEHDDPTLKMAFCGRLNACLRLLQPSLLDPIPDHMMDSLTVDTLPTRSPRFDPECTELCHYCLALTQVLTGQGLLPETRDHLGCLLYDLIHYFSDEITAPRWLRTADGVKFIDGVAA